MSSVQKFWFDKLKDGTLDQFDDKWKAKVKSENLFNQYLEFAGKIGDRFKLNNVQFGKEIKDLCPEVVRKKLKSEYPNERAWYYCFPKLEECRKTFEERINIPIKWDEI